MPRPDAVQEAVRLKEVVREVQQAAERNGNETLAQEARVRDILLGDVIDRKEDLEETILSVREWMASAGVKAPPSR